MLSLPRGHLQFIKFDYEFNFLAMGKGTFPNIWKFNFPNKRVFLQIPSILLKYIDCYISYVSQVLLLLYINVKLKCERRRRCYVFFLRRLLLRCRHLYVKNFPLGNYIGGRTIFPPCSNLLGSIFLGNTLPGGVGGGGGIFREQYSVYRNINTIHF